MYNPNAFSFHEGLYRTYGTITRVYGFLGVCLASEYFLIPGPNNQCHHLEQDIQLVVSDPKACNNIFVKDQNVFEETEAFLT